jgi:hypothetical protein
MSTHWRGFLGVGAASLIVATWVLVSCSGNVVSPGSGGTDCVAVLQVNTIRGYRVANVARFGEGEPTLRTASRIGELATDDLRAFCDWEACIRAYGYDHTCWLDDGGVERCKVCDGSADCNGRPLNQDDCVAQASDPTRVQCHVGLLQECLIQQALRGPGDPCVTQACALSDEACAGQLPGDLSSQALAAQGETAQVSVGECMKEAMLSAQLAPDGAAADFSYATTILSEWDGGLAACDDDAPWLAALLDAGASDAGED